MGAPAIGNTADIAIDFGSSSSVIVKKASIVDQSDQTLTLAGQLYRPHRLPMVGHLHVYAYLENGDLVSDSKHRVLGLNSQRHGSMRIPFRVSIESATNEIDRLFLEYHSPGHSES
jgi:hypothetical protein